MKIGKVKFDFVPLLGLQDLEGTHEQKGKSVQC